MKVYGEKQHGYKNVSSFYSEVTQLCFSGWQLQTNQQPTEQVNIFSV